jgi:hypothetical protein
MQRKLLGIVALVLLALGLITTLRGPTDGGAKGFAGGCIRVGMVLGALWLALPQIKATAASLPRWAMAKLLRPKRPVEPNAGGGPIKPVPRPRRRSRSRS